MSIEHRLASYDRGAY